MKYKSKITDKLKHYFKILGPGLITGASDDDPSGIATYSQAGSQFGLATLWTALLTFPLMAAVQGMCARIGLVTRQGMARTLRLNYPVSILYIVMALSFISVTLNVGADIQSMGAVANMLIPKVPVFAFSLIFSVLMIYMIIKFPYQKMASVLKWLCITLLFYVIIPFLVKQNWMDVLKNTVVPTIHFNKAFLSILVAVLGTTISPYLFFWQATMEAEDINRKKLIVNKSILDDAKEDTNTGMFFSNFVMFFIILATGIVLHAHGITNIDTVDKAAKALEPAAGKFAYLLFTIGIITTGFLAIPVLVGSISYMLAETFGWEEGFNKRFYQARGFYITGIISVIVGLALNFAGVSPIQALLYTAILYGLVAPVMIAVVLHISNNKKIMGDLTNNSLSNALGFITLILMTAAAIALIYFQFA